MLMVNKMLLSRDLAMPDEEEVPTAELDVRVAACEFNVVGVVVTAEDI